MMLPSRATQHLEPGCPGLRGGLHRPCPVHEVSAGMGELQVVQAERGLHGAAAVQGCSTAMSVGHRSSGTTEWQQESNMPMPCCLCRNREAVNNGYASAVRAVVARWDSLGLSRKAKVTSCTSSRAALDVNSSCCRCHWRLGLLLNGMACVCTRHKP